MRFLQQGPRLYCMLFAGLWSKLGLHLTKVVPVMTAGPRLTQSGMSRAERGAPTMAPGLTSSWQLTAWLPLKELMRADRHAQLCIVPVECTVGICWIIAEQGTSSMLVFGSAAEASAAAEAGQPVRPHQQVESSDY